MILEFGNVEHIRLKKEYEKREVAIKRSGLSREEFYLKKEIQYWNNPNKIPSNCSN